MSSDDSEDTFLGGVPYGIVKGGTTTSRYDKEMKTRDMDAQRRRTVQDAMYAKAQTPRRPGEIARLGSRTFVNPTTPRLVLSYRNKDKTIRQQAISEVTMVAVDGKSTEMETTFTMVCPRCVARGVPQGEAQMHVRDSHRKFWIDERKRGLVMVEYAWGQRQAVMVAGTVTCQDVIRCSNYNCDFACRIDNSDVYEV